METETSTTYNITIKSEDFKTVDVKCEVDLESDDCEIDIKYKPDVELKEEIDCVDVKPDCSSMQLEVFDAKDKIISNDYTKIEHKCDESSDTASLKCSLCSYTTTNKNYLKRHIRRHSTFKCDQCDYSATLKRDLISHKATHLTKKRFNCSNCDYGTNRKHSFKEHTFKHTTDRPHACDLCDMAFKSIKTLNTHKIVHKEGERKCNICGFVTRWSHSLQLHMKSHNGSAYQKKLYSCSECNYTSMVKKLFINHSEFHNPEMRYKCDKCPFGAKDITLLVTHMKTHLK